MERTKPERLRALVLPPYQLLVSVYLRINQVKRFKGIEVSSINSISTAEPCFRFHPIHPRKSSVIPNQPLGPDRTLNPSSRVPNCPSCPNGLRIKKSTRSRLAPSVARLRSNELPPEPSIRQFCRVGVPCSFANKGRIHCSPQE